MGLDMYLHAKQDLHAYEHVSDDAEKELFRRVLETVDAYDWVNHGTPHLTVTVTVAYWRKAHTIHQWFVRNVQDGNDNCHEYPVERETLGQLVAICNTALASKSITEAHRLLSHRRREPSLRPMEENWYWQSLELTRDQLSRCLVTVPERWNFYYQSSW